MNSFYKKIILIIAVLFLFLSSTNIQKSEFIALAQDISYGDPSGSTDGASIANLNNNITTTNNFDPVNEFTKIINAYKQINDPKNNKNGNWYALWFNKDSTTKVINATLNDILISFKSYIYNINKSSDSNNISGISKFTSAGAVALIKLDQNINNIQKQIDTSEASNQAKLAKYKSENTPQNYWDLDKSTTTNSQALSYLRYVYQDLSSEINNISLGNNSNDNKAIQDAFDKGNTKRGSDLQASINTEAEKACQSLWESMTSDKCNFFTYIFSGIITVGTNVFVQPFFWTSGELFDLSVTFSIYDFGDFVGGSTGIIHYVWKIILSLVASSILPFIIYLLIKQIIKNDDSFEKVMWPIMITAFFIYFSFAIGSFLIDQSNIISIYIYRAITDGGSKTIFDNIKGQFNGLAPTGGQSGAILASLGLLVTYLAGTFVLIQASILMLSRAIILIITLAFSPILIIPTTGVEIIDKWKSKGWNLFVNNLIMAPILIFIFNIALLIYGGLLNSKMLFTSLDGSGGFSNLSTLLGLAFLIALMQIAITVSKNLSNEISSKIVDKFDALANTKKLFGSGVKNTFGRARGAFAERAANFMDNNKWMNKERPGYFGQGLNSTLKNVNSGLRKTAQNSVLGDRVKKDEEYYNTLKDEGTKREYISRMSKGSIMQKNLSKKLLDKEFQNISSKDQNVSSFVNSLKRSGDKEAFTKDYMQEWLQGKNELGKQIKSEQEERQTKMDKTFEEHLEENPELKDSHINSDKVKQSKMKQDFEKEKALNNKYDNIYSGKNRDNGKSAEENLRQNRERASNQNQNSNQTNSESRSTNQGENRSQDPQREENRQNNRSANQNGSPEKPAIYKELERERQSPTEVKTQITDDYGNAIDGRMRKYGMDDQGNRILNKVNESPKSTDEEIPKNVNSKNRILDKIRQNRANRKSEDK